MPDLTEAQRQAAQEIMDRWPQWFGRKGMRTNEQLRFMLDLAQTLAKQQEQTDAAKAAAIHLYTCTGCGTCETLYDAVPRG